jgi:hypothetical protein
LESAHVFVVPALHGEALSLILVRDHNLDFALEYDVELGSVITEPEDVLALVVEVILQFLAQVVQILVVHLPLLEERDVFDDLLDVHEIFVLPLLLVLEKHRDNIHELISWGFMSILEGSLSCLHDKFYISSLN